MQSKFQFDSKWSVGGGWISHLISQLGLKYPINGIEETELPR